MPRTPAIVCALVFTLSAPALAQPETKSVGPEVPPEISMDVYEARRDRLAKKLGSCVGVLKAQAKPGELDPWFYFLTGVDEDGAMLMIAPREPIYRTALALRPRDPELEIWEGYREPMSYQLRKKYRVDELRRSRGPLPRRFGRALGRARCFAVLRGPKDKPDIAGKVLGNYLTSYSARTEQKWQELEKLRAVHDAAGLARMKKAIAITIEGQRAAARELRAGVKERHVAAQIEAAFFAHGATGVAFPSIVAAGPSGAILHWEKRDRVVGADDLVVVDIGSEYGHYASDITRTFPVSGTFSGEQKKVYEAVLAVQKKVIAAVKPGVSLDRLNRMAEELIVEAGYEPAHYVGHFVGLDVHDVGDVTAPLEPGMVITVEPGIYLKDKFGVRIEDMVLVTPRGGELLTGELPREVPEVEAFVKAARGQ